MPPDTSPEPSSTQEPSRLAYVFWHRPSPDVDLGHYEADLRAFHAALGRPGSVTFSIASTPWDDGPAAYQDWYPVADWGDVGRLNEEAVSAGARAAHDAVAARAAWGAGAIYGRLRGASGDREPAAAAWLVKPAGQSYDDFLAGLPPAMVVWRRQLVLGPAPEFALFATDPSELPAAATVVERRQVAP